MYIVTFLLLKLNLNSFNLHSQNKTYYIILYRWLFFFFFFEYISSNILMCLPHAGSIALHRWVSGSGAVRLLLAVATVVAAAGGADATAVAATARLGADAATVAAETVSAVHGVVGIVDLRAGVAAGQTSGGRWGGLEDDDLRCRFAVPAVTGLRRSVRGVAVAGRRSVRGVALAGRRSVHGVAGSRRRRRSVSRERDGRRGSWLRLWLLLVIVSSVEHRGRLGGSERRAESLFEEHFLRQQVVD